MISGLQPDYGWEVVYGQTADGLILSARIATIRITSLRSAAALRVSPARLLPHASWRVPCRTPPRKRIRCSVGRDEW